MFKFKKYFWLNPKSVSIIAASLSFLATSSISLEPVSASEYKGTKFVSPEWVSTNSNDPNLKILDVRTNPFDYFVGHIPNAVNLPEMVLRAPLNGLPLQFLSYDELGQSFARAGVNDKSRVVIYSDGVGILGASMTAYALERAGFTNQVAILDGGFSDYKATKPITREYPKYTPTSFQVKDNAAIRVTLTEVADLIGKKNVVFIDPRPPKSFRGEEDIFTRNGHIPGAINIPWQTFTPDGNQHKLKPLDEIRQILADKKIDKSKTIVVSCTTGREATLPYVVLKHLLGYPNIRIYEGSWTEYSQSNLPVATGEEKPLN